MPESNEVRIAVLEKDHDRLDKVVGKFIELADSTKNLLVAHTARFEALTSDVVEHKADDKAFHEEVKKFFEKLTEDNKEFLGKLNDDHRIQLENINKDFKETTVTLNKRLSFLERWWYIICGAAAVVGVIGEVLWDKFGDKILK